MKLLRTCRERVGLKKEKKKSEGREKWTVSFFLFFFSLPQCLCFEGKPLLAAHGGREKKKKTLVEDFCCEKAQRSSRITKDKIVIVGANVDG